MLTLLLMFACVDEVPAVPQAAVPISAPAPTPSVDPVVASMRRQPIRTTKHGECRMACRKISDKEVEAILMSDGVRDPSRSRTDDGKCPSHALEGKSLDGPQVRIVFAACDDVTLVVTTIDLDTDWPCECS